VKQTLPYGESEIKVIQSLFGDLVHKPHFLNSGPKREPVSPLTGKIKPERWNTDHLSTLECAVGALSLYQDAKGLGVALPEGWVFLDFDGVLPATLDPNKSLVNQITDQTCRSLIVAALRSGLYVELSHSEEGFHILAPGVWRDKHDCVLKRHEADSEGKTKPMIEAYSKLGSRYAAITGRIIPGATTRRADIVKIVPLLNKLFPEAVPHTVHKDIRISGNNHGPMDELFVRELAGYCTHRAAGDEPSWWEFVVAVCEASSGANWGFRICDEISQRCSGRYERAAMLTKWKHACSRLGGLITPGSLVHMAEEGGWRKPSERINGSHTAPPVGQQAKTEERPRKKIEILTATQSIEGENEEPSIDGLAEKGDLVALSGLGSSGKTLVAIPMATAIARGDTFCGMNCTQGPVVYLATENPRHIRRRFKAYWQAMGYDASKIPLYIIPTSVNFFRNSDDARYILEDLAEAGITNVAALFVDTHNRTMAGGNDNAQQDTTLWLENFTTLVVGLNTTPYIITHQARTVTGLIRGSGALEFSTEVVLTFVKERGASEFFVTVERARELPEGTTWRFELKTEDIEWGGRTKNIAYSVWDGEKPSPTKTSKKINPRTSAEQALVLRSLKNLLVTEGESIEGRFGFPDTPIFGVKMPGLDQEAASDGFYPEKGWTPKRSEKDPKAREEMYLRARYSALNRIVTGLMKSGQACMREGWVWIPHYQREAG